MHNIQTTEGLRFQFADYIAIAFQSKDLKYGSVNQRPRVNEHLFPQLALKAKS